MHPLRSAWVARQNGLGAVEVDDEDVVGRDFRQPA